MIQPKILILGYGHLGAAFSRLYGHYQIRGVRRSHVVPAPPGLIQMPIQSEALIPHIEWADVILFCAAPGRRDLVQYRKTYLDNITFLFNLIKKYPTALDCFILISSTGVYPRGMGGRWQEEDPIPIETPLQKILLDTEQAVMASGLPYAILRSGGIYGQERGYLHRVMQQEKIMQSGMSEQWVTSIHQDDLCGIIHEVIDRRIIGKVFNAVDHTQLTKRQWAERISEEMGLPVISDGSSQEVPCRQVSNDRLKEKVGYHFRYPTVITFLEEQKRKRSELN
jgi:nucleoside-diphosphate-sugar epimerase